MCSSMALSGDVLSFFENLNVTVDVPRDGSPDEQQIRFRDHLNHPEMLHGHALAAHAAGHAHPLAHPRRVRACTDRTGRAFGVALSVRPEPSAEMMAFDDALKTPSLRRPGDGNKFALGEERVDLDLRAEREPGRIEALELAKHLLRGDARLLEVSGGGLVHEPDFGVAKPELDRFVTVGFLRLDLGHETGPRFDDRTGNGFACFVEDTRHPDFFT